MWQLRSDRLMSFAVVEKKRPSGKHPRSIHLKMQKDGAFSLRAVFTIHARFRVPLVDQPVEIEEVRLDREDLDLTESGLLGVLPERRRPHHGAGCR